MRCFGAGAAAHDRGAHHIPLRDVQIAARHADPRTTMPYVGLVRTWTAARLAGDARHCRNCCVSRQQ